MSNTAKWIVAAALAMAVAGCAQPMDAGYAAPSYGYGNGYYAGGYSPQQAYYAPPVVYSQTRYVPVPTPVPVPAHQADRGNDRRWDVRHDEPHHVAHQPSPPATSSHSDNSHRDGSRAHDNDRRS